VTRRRKVREWLRKVVAMRRNLGAERRNPGTERRKVAKARRKVGMERHKVAAERCNPGAGRRESAQVSSDAVANRRNANLLGRSRFLRRHDGASLAQPLCGNSCERAPVAQPTVRVGHPLRGWGRDDGLTE